jgi:hypothetical protein
MTRSPEVPPNPDEASLNEAVSQVQAQAGWCPKIGEIPRHELQTLLSIAIRSYFARRSGSRRPGRRARQGRF